MSDSGLRTEQGAKPVRTRVEATVWLWLDLDPAADNDEIAQAVQDDIGYAGVVVVTAEAVEYAS